MNQQQLFHLQHRCSLFADDGFLNRIGSEGSYLLDNNTHDETIQTAFTNAEVQQLEEDYNILKYFKAVPVFDMTEQLVGG